jgi:type IV secretion system protein VirB6
MFSLAVLSAMVSIATEMVTRVAAYYWAGSLLSSLTGMSSEGLSSVALQQGGIGLILTVMLVSAPPMAAAFFNGVMGQFQSYSAYQGGLGAGARGPGSPPSQGYGGSQRADVLQHERYGRVDDARREPSATTADPRALGVGAQATGVPNDGTPTPGLGARGLAGSASAEPLRAPTQASPANQPAQPIPPPPAQPPPRNG